MADRKVSELPAADALVGTEIVPGAQAGVTKKITVADIAALATGTGDVTGPASSTDNALARFHETGGKTLQNSVATVSDNGALTLTGATVTTSQPIIDVTQTWNDAAVAFTGLKANITDTASAAGSSIADFQVGGSSKFSVSKTGVISQTASDRWLLQFISSTKAQGGVKFREATDGAETAYIGYFTAVLKGVQITSTSIFGWSGSTSASSTTPDLILYRDDAATLAQRNTTNAQTYRLYNTYTGTNDYERLAFTWDSNTAKIQTEAAGNGTLRTLQLGPMYTATLKSGVLVTPVTTTASPAATDTGAVYTNEGDADGATVTLPTAAAGLRFTVYVQAAQTLTVTAGSGDTIRIASNVTSAAGSITSAVVGSSVSLLAINATEWIATSSIGSWSF